jgi:hypothetical protein
MTTPAQPGQPDGGALGRQLIRQAEAISQLRHDLDQLASKIADSIADLHTRLDSTDDTPAGMDGAGGVASTGVMAWCWRYLGP